VAIARGIVMNHKVLLLDESLCSLDLKLKREMQIELKKIQKKLGITFIYVTHDQDEALTMSDRIVIINNGVIEQLGSPKEIYKNPKTAFAADFIGESDLIKSKIYKIEKGRAYLKLFDSIDITIPDNNYNIGNALLVIRPENFKFQKKKTVNSFKGIISNYVYDGALVKLEVKVKNEILKINVYGNDDFEEGKEVYISIDTDKLIVIGD
jgi:spermidine/putrescine transport system ATP-binding protein